MNKLFFLLVLAFHSFFMAAMEPVKDENQLFTRLCFFVRKVRIHIENRENAIVYRLLSNPENQEMIHHDFLTQKLYAVMNDKAVSGFSINMDGTHLSLDAIKETALSLATIGRNKNFSFVLPLYCSSPGIPYDGQLYYEKLSKPSVSLQMSFSFSSGNPIHNKIAFDDLIKKKESLRIRNVIVLSFEAIKHYSLARKLHDIFYGDVSSVDLTEGELQIVPFDSFKKVAMDLAFLGRNDDFLKRMP